MERERERRKGLEDDPFETKKRLPIIPACTDVKPGQIEEREASVKACTSSFSFSPGFKFVWRTLDFWRASAPAFHLPFSLSLSLERVKKKRGKTWTTSWTFVPLSSNRSKKREYDRRSTGIWTKKEKLKFPSKVSPFFPSPLFRLLWDGRS